MRTSSMGRLGGVDPLRVPRTPPRLPQPERSASQRSRRPQAFVEVSSGGLSTASRRGKSVEPNARKVLPYDVRTNSAIGSPAPADTNTGDVLKLPTPPRTVVSKRNNHVAPRLSAGRLMNQSDFYRSQRPLPSASSSTTSEPVTSTSSRISSPRLTRTPTLEHRPALIPPPRPQDEGKLVVVLDLDETLVYGRDGDIHVRPGVDKLLKVLKGQCELIVWTAGTRDYALEVIHLIDTTCAIQHCIFRHPMWWTGESDCSKNLRMLGRPLDAIILVDNTPLVFRANPHNSILVQDYLGTYAPKRIPDRVLPTLADVFDTAFRLHGNPKTCDVLADRRITRRRINLEGGGGIDLNILTDSVMDSGW